MGRVEWRGVGPATESGCHRVILRNLLQAKSSRNVVVIIRSYFIDSPDGLIMDAFS